MKRLTINPGLRVQWVETGMYESSMAAGRFAPARFIEEERGLIDFGADYSPRFSAVYDLFGDGRTALKTSWSRYYRNYDGDIAANAYGRAGERSETAHVARPQSDCRHQYTDWQPCHGVVSWRSGPSDGLRRRRAGQRDRDQPERRCIRQSRSARSQNH